MIRFAIIGSGGIAAKHAQAIAAVPGAQLAAVWGAMPEQGAKFAAENGAEFVPDISALAAREDIHAATIATPSGAHAMAALPASSKPGNPSCARSRSTRPLKESTP